VTLPGGSRRCRRRLFCVKGSGAKFLHDAGNIVGDTGKLTLQTALPRLVSGAPEATEMPSDRLKGTAEQQATKETAKITEALTPKLTPTKYKAAGAGGKLDNPTCSREQVWPRTPRVQKAVTAVKAVAADMARPPLISSGLELPSPRTSTVSTTRLVRTPTRWFAPFLSKNPVHTNFADFIDYIKQVKPEEAIRANPDAAKPSIVSASALSTRCIHH